MLSLPEKDIRYFAAKATLPVIKSPCPADGNTEREEVKFFLTSLEKKYGNVREKILGAMQRKGVNGY